MVKALNIIRSHEWWEFKLPPLLALGYATALSSTMPLYKVGGWLVLLLLSIVIGAIYVSTINDITDMDEDLASGKSNRMAKIPARYRWMIPAVCILLGLVFISVFLKDTLSRVLYFLPWISFSLYSFPPVRLKKRGIWGVMADASGSHIFISLLIVSSVSAFTGRPIDWLWFAAVGVWAFTYGLRGILWHQFYDRDNDLKVNLKTYATRVNPESFKSIAILITVVELVAFTIMLVKVFIPLTLIFLGFYFILAFINYKKLSRKLILILAPQGKSYQILMADYYHFFYPVSLLLFAALTQPLAWIVLVIHILLFNNVLKNTARLLLKPANN